MKEKKKKTVKEKEIYKIQWEYLKRSEDYERFCNWMPDLEEDKDISDKMHSICRNLRIQHPNDADGLVDYWLGQSALTALYEYDDPVIKRLHESNKLDSMLENFRVFGNVHSHSFENWWERQGQYLKEVYDKYVGGDFDAGLIYIKFKRPVCGVEDYKEFIKRDIGWCISKFSSKNERKPTCHELGDSLLERISNHKGYVYLVVDVVDKSLKDLTKQFEKIVRKHKQDTSIKQLKEDQKRYFKPISNKDEYIRIEEIKRYLKVYDLKKKGLRIQDIIKEFKRTTKASPVDVQRAYYLDIKRAKKIIENVEKGVFPGEYQPS